MASRVCIFGEVLFDHFPVGRPVLGGAPFNVAWHLQAFGRNPFFISCVGADDEGREILSAMQGWSMDTRGIHTDEGFATGKVLVSFIDGEPSYDIVNPVAYDRIKLPPEMPACRVLYHGSLALRDRYSLDSLEQIQSSVPATVFVDVNLRPPWWQREQVLHWMGQAHWVKLNQHELEELWPHGPDDLSRARALLEAKGLRGVVLTRGSAGAILMTADGGLNEVRPEPGIRVVDTVGAGDAFTSVIMLGLELGWSPQVSLDRAQAFASAVVGQRGATVSTPAFYAPFINDWQL